MTDTLAMPYNATTGAEYRGGNIERLLMAEIGNGYGNGGWAGFHQWIEAGRVVRKGEHGTHCLTVVTVDEKKTDGTAKTTRKPRGFVVFHYDQTDELQPRS